MTGISWIRLDSSFPTNPKILWLADQNKYRAISVYVCALAYAGSHGTEGFVPNEALPVIHGRKLDANQLVAIGLFEPETGGWSIHNWHDYQPTNDTIAARTQRARNAAAARWNGHNGTNE